MMQLIEHQQGTAEWHTHRQTHFNASEAAAMLGVSPYTKRDALLAQKKTGITPEVNQYQQAIFDKGHLIESLLRPVAEQQLGQELYPCVGVLEGTKLSASFDGLTMDERTVFEAKTLNQTLRKSQGKPLPLHYRAQLEQQLLVSGAEKALFMAASLNDAGEISDQLQVDYSSDPELRQRIIHGWQQFEKDLAEYPAKDATAIAPIADALPALPALHIAASGQLIESNLTAFKTKALIALAQINTHLVTDQDFAEAEESVKWCKQVEQALDKAQQTLLSSAGIAIALNELNNIASLVKKVRLQQDKSIKEEKENRKHALIQTAKERIEDHIKALNEGLPDDRQIEIPPCVDASLTRAAKGLKSLASLQNALDSVALETISKANAESLCKAQQAPPAEPLPPASSAKANPAERINLAQINCALWPLHLYAEHHFCGLDEDAADHDRQHVKQTLIRHIEQVL